MSHIYTLDSLLYQFWTESFVYLERWAQNNVRIDYVDDIEWHLGRFNEPDFNESFWFLLVTMLSSLWVFLPVRLKTREELRLSEVFNFVTRFSIVGRKNVIIISIGQVSLQRWKLLRIVDDILFFLLSESELFCISCQRNWVSHGSSKNKSL